MPEEVAIVLAGVLSAQGHLHTWTALAACIVGAILGDSVMYAIGYRWGHGLLSYHPRMAKLLGAEREKRFEQAIEQHAFKVMFLSRFLVGIRGPVYLATGVVRLPYQLFLLYDLVCATIVVSFFFGLAYVFGDQVGNWIRDAEMTATVVVLLAILLLGSYLYYRHRTTIYRTLFDGDAPRER